MIKKIMSLIGTCLVLYGLYWAVSRYGYITDKGSVNIDHHELSKDWNKVCDEASEDITEWAWKFGKKFDMFVDE